MEGNDKEERYHYEDVTEKCMLLQYNAFKKNNSPHRPSFAYWVFSNFQKKKGPRSVPLPFHLYFNLSTWHSFKKCSFNFLYTHLRRAGFLFILRPYVLLQVSVPYILYLTVIGWQFLKDTEAQNTKKNPESKTKFLVF